MKKILSILLVGIISSVFSAENSSPTQNSNEYNNPAVAGGRNVDSSQTFGDPALVNKKLTKESQTSLRGSNNPAVGGGRNVGSSQIFGNQKIITTPNKTYYTKKQLDNPENDPSVAGGRNVSSSQLFDNDESK